MLSKEELKTKAEKMNAFLQLEVGSEPNDIIDRIEKLSILLSQSGEYLAQAKYLQDTITSSEIMKIIKEGYVEKSSITTVNKLINSLAKEENFLVNSFDRINSAAGKQSMGLVTVLSYRKAEFSTLNYSSGRA